MKTTKEKRERERLKKLKLEARKKGILHDVPDNYWGTGKKRVPTGEYELFKKIALERSLGLNHVEVPHIFPDGKIGVKAIFLKNLEPINFSHIKPKGMYHELRLEPSNIEIVSRAYHEWQHSLQIPQTNYIN